MKIKIQYKGRYLTLGYVSATKNTIVVWYTPQAITGRLADDVMQNLDLHATYPVSGDFHYSYKYVSLQDNLRYDKKIYHDRIVVVIKDKEGNFINKIPCQRNGADFLEHMVPDKPAQSLDDKDFTMFLFPQGAISMVKKNLDMITEESKPAPSDIILNVDNFEDAILNYGFSLYNKNREDFYQHGHVKRVLHFDNVYAEGFVRIVKEASDQ